MNSVSSIYARILLSKGIKLPVTMFHGYSSIGNFLKAESKNWVLANMNTMQYRFLWMVKGITFAIISLHEQSMFVLGNILKSYWPLIFNGFWRLGEQVRKGTALTHFIIRKKTRQGIFGWPLVAERCEHACLNMLWVEGYDKIPILLKSELT